MDKHYILRKKEKENIVKNPVHTRYCAWRRYCCQSVITDRSVCNFYIYVDTKRKDQVSMRGKCKYYLYIF